MSADPKAVAKPSFRPLTHYMKSGKINWSRLSDDDKRTVIVWMRQVNPAMVDAIVELKKTFGDGVTVPYIEIDPKFWFWLADRRAQERRRQELGQQEIRA